MSGSDELRAQARVGTVLSEKWALERLVGVGGMAAVYAARHRNGARAAIKVLHPGLSRHAEVRERFLREGYAANRVEHPGVVKVLDDDVVAGGPDAGTAYLVMELLDGESLQERIERPPPMDEREFLTIAESILDVLQAAHEHGVVHRDLKPENLFLVNDPESGAAKPRVKVLDFGLARLLQGEAITTYGLALGTPSFMSPEQAAGRIDEIDGRTDLFALAATGYRIRTGRRIHEGANAVELVTKMASAPAPAIRSVAPDVSDAFARIIDRALAFQREDRYATAADMRRDVQLALVELGSCSTAQTWIAVPAVSPPPAAPIQERTLEVRDEDLERTRVRVEPAPARAWPEESIRIPRQRSVWPWVALLALGAAGAKLWIDARGSTNGVSAPAAGSSAAAASAEAPEPLDGARADSGAAAGHASPAPHRSGKGHRGARQ